MNSPIKFGFDRDGAFWCLCLDRRLGVYSYASSPNADDAAKHHEDEAYLLRLSTLMLKGEENMRKATGDSEEYYAQAFQWLCQSPAKRIPHFFVTNLRG